MKIKNEKFIIQTKGFDDIIDITQRVKTIIDFVGINDGLVTVSTSLPTVSVIRIENTPGLAADIKNLYNNLAPVNRIYEHDNAWYDGNAYSHLKASFLGGSVTLPIIRGSIELPQSCAISIIDFNNRPQSVSVVVSVLFNEDKNND